MTDPPYHFNTIVERFGASDAAPAKSDGPSGVYARASAGFMGKTWDGGDIAFRPETWAAVLRVLKPGGHLAAFSAPKCVHRMGMAIELAGFEIRDRIINLIDPDPHVIAFLESLSPAQADALFRLTEHFGALGEAFWCFGTGFPKNHDVAMAIDKALGAVRDRLPPQMRARASSAINDSDYGSAEWSPPTSDPVTPEAAAWAGHGTALKPAYEPIVIARKPLAETSIARQVLATGTGAINIDGARIPAQIAREGEAAAQDLGQCRQSLQIAREGEAAAQDLGQTKNARYPANLTHDGSDAVEAMFPNAPGAMREVNDSFTPKRGTAVYGDYGPRSTAIPRGDSGSAARFFYSGKAASGDRIGSRHPTVKPVDQTRWLVRLMTPMPANAQERPVVLDLFAGTGTTGEAAWLEGFDAILIEREPEYHADIAERMRLCQAGPREKRRAIAARRALADRDTAPDLFTPQTPSEEPAMGAARREIYGHFADEGPKEQSHRKRGGGRTIGPIGLSGSRSSDR